MGVGMQHSHFYGNKKVSGLLSYDISGGGAKMDMTGIVSGG